MLSVAATFGALALSTAAEAKTFVIPHVLEASGSINTTQYTFDTSLFMEYTAGRAGVPDGGGASVDLYLFDQASGQPMTGGGGGVVCNPCNFALNAATPSRSLVVDDLINAAGGFGGASVKLGFGVVVVSGDADNVGIQASVVNAHTSPFDVSAVMFNPREYNVSRFAPPGETRRVFVMPHILEKSGTISSTQFSFDTTLFAVYAAGIGDVPSGGGADVQLYLYDKSSGEALRGAGGTDVCNPCVASLSQNARKRSFNVDSLIMANGGGFDAEVKEAFGIVVVTGDVGAVELQGFVVNSHTSAFDVSVFGFNPQEISAPARVAVDDPVSSLRRPDPMVSFPNPFNPNTTLVFELARQQEVTLQIHDAAGRLVRTLLHETRGPGQQSIAWDGKDDAGQALASGVYHATLVATDGRLSTKLVLLQ